MTDHIDKAKAALESCDGWPVNGTTDMALLAIANALVAIAEGREPCHMRFDGCKTCGVYEGGETRYGELFGTPERTAQYFAMQCFGSDGSLCYYCPFDDCDERLRNMGAYPTVYDALLEWLRGDA